MMKLPFTLIAITSISLSAHAATTFTNAGVTNTDGGNYFGVSANLGDAGWDVTGDAVGATVQLTGVTLYRRSGGGADDASSFLNVYDSGGSFVGSSTNQLNLGTGITAEGALIEFSFSNLEISATETYSYRFSQTNTDGGTANEARLQVVQPENLANGEMLNSSYVGQDTSFDPKYIITVVPEPSSAALLGLGGLALVLRRRK